MKKAELIKLRGKTPAELVKLVSEKKNDVKKSKNLRRDIAQILSILKETKLNENTSG